MSQPAPSTCPFCPSGEALVNCRCSDARYARVVGVVAARRAFLGKGGILRDGTTSESIEAMRSVAEEALAQPEPEPAPRAVPVDQVPACGFCGKREHECGYLFKGPLAAICDECLSLGAAASREHDHPIVGTVSVEWTGTQFAVNQDGTTPTTQPRGICPSCDKRRDYAATAAANQKAKV